MSKQNKEVFWNIHKLGRRRRPQLTSPIILAWWESIPWQIDKKSRGPQGEKCLELLAPICKKEVTSTILLFEVSLSALDAGVDRLYTKAFLPWSNLVCPLLMQVLYSSLPVLPLRQGGDALGIDLMASKTDVQFLTIKTLLASDATQDAIRVTFLNASQAKIAGENICHLSACPWPWVYSWPQ